MAGYPLSVCFFVFFLIYKVFGGFEKGEKIAIILCNYSMIAFMTLFDCFLVKEGNLWLFKIKFLKEGNFN